MKSPAGFAFERTYISNTLKSAHIKLPGLTDPANTPLPFPFDVQNPNCN